MTKKSKSFLWMLVLPVPIAMALAVAASGIVVPRLLAENVRGDAVESARSTVEQFKTVRQYYTDIVVKKVLDSKALAASSDHATNANAIPLPATMIHDLSALLGQKGINLNLYSGHPFPNRQDRKLDSFQTEAWAYLAQNPTSEFIRQEERNGRQIVRVAVPDTMAQGCVACHNSHADSPKKNWKVGDVRGVLEVASVIDAPLARGAVLSQGLIVSTIIIGLLVSIVCFVAGRRVSKPVRAMTGAMQSLAGGDKSVDIPGTTRSDEVGAMANAVVVFKENMIEADNLRDAQEKLKAQTESERRAATLKMADEFETGVGGVVQTVAASATQMQSSAQSLSATAEETTKQAGAVAAASELASANVQTVASSAEELSSSISEISRQVAQSAKIAADAVTEAGRADEMVQGLATASQKIGEVVALITDIADQTNLLALNATIEAARAGEAGKGFAVVAAEVKNLATQTAKATEEIGGQISGIQGATQNAVSAIKGIGKTIAEISEIASSIAAAVEEQGAATNEIARNVEQAAKGTQEVSNNIVGVNRAANDTGTASEQVLSSARQLTEQSDALKGIVEKFLSEVRAA